LLIDGDVKSCDSILVGVTVGATAASAALSEAANGEEAADIVTPPAGVLRGALGSAGDALDCMCDEPSGDKHTESISALSIDMSRCGEE
jgi:hypothetical protein